MLFSELYSAYYNVVAEILCAAVKSDITEKQIRRLIMEKAFGESVLNIIPAIKEGRWMLFDEEFCTPIEHEPTIPLTNLQKQWLKAISMDRRVSLFGAIPEFPEVEPLFTPEDIGVFDRYTDGDPYEDEHYREIFRTLLRAIREKKTVTVKVRNRKGNEITHSFVPACLEYSEKDDKFRVMEDSKEYRFYNVGRLLSAELTNGAPAAGKQHPDEYENERICEVVLEMGDYRNTMERVMLHFAHFEKQAEKIGKNRYRVKIRYYKSDETEMIIRVLSFGSFVKVIEPEPFIELIKERLRKQKNCGF